MTTKEEIMKLAEECGATIEDGYPYIRNLEDGDFIETFYHAARKEERERCAKVCEAKAEMLRDDSAGCLTCAAAIRKMED